MSSAISITLETFVTAPVPGGGSHASIKKPRGKFIARGKGFLFSDG